MKRSYQSNYVSWGARPSGGSLGKSTQRVPLRMPWRWNNRQSRQTDENAGDTRGRLNRCGPRDNPETAVNIRNRESRSKTRFSLPVFDCRRDFEQSERECERPTAGSNDSHSRARRATSFRQSTRYPQASATSAGPRLEGLAPSYRAHPDRERAPALILCELDAALARHVRMCANNGGRRGAT